MTRPITSFPAALAAAVALSLAAMPVAAQRDRDGFDREDDAGEARVFNFPRLGGLPLDICPRDLGVGGVLAGRCGQTVADRFCRSRGFEGAAEAPQVAAGGPTRFLSGGVCDHGLCHTFRYIVCE